MSNQVDCTAGAILLFDSLQVARQMPLCGMMHGLD